MKVGDVMKMSHGWEDYGKDWFCHYRVKIVILNKNSVVLRVLTSADGKTPISPFIERYDYKDAKKILRPYTKLELALL